MAGITSGDTLVNRHPRKCNRSKLGVFLDTMPVYQEWPSHQLEPRPAVGFWCYAVGLVGGIANDVPSCGDGAWILAPYRGTGHVFAGVSVMRVKVLMRLAIAPP